MKEKTLSLTHHAVERMTRRRICYRDIMFAVRYGDVVHDGKTVMYELRNMRRFSGDVFPAPLVALVQRRSVLVVVAVPTARGEVVKTVYWKHHGKNTGGVQS